MGWGMRMAYTSTLRDGFLIGLLVLAQFFWLLATFAYSDTDRASGRASGHENARGDATVTASIITATPAEPSAPRSPNVSFPDVGGTLDPAIPSSPSTPGPDLGAQIKYCIVFPLLNAAGEPIPQFDVPACPNGPPLPGSPKLTVIKIVINDDKGSATTTDFTLRVGSTTVSSGVQRTFLAGTYVVSEATTTVTVGTTTQKYVPEFSGDCDSSGRVTLTAGDIKTCTIINDDEGPGGQGGDGGGGPSGGGPSGGGPSGGGPSGGGPSGGSSGGGPSGASSGGSSGGAPSGQVAGAVTPQPDFMGGPDGEPGAPNAGAGGGTEENIGLLIFSFMAAVLGSFSIGLSLKKKHRNRFSVLCTLTTGT